MTPHRAVGAILLTVGSLFCSVVNADQTLEKYLSNEEVENAIARWSKAEASYYTLLYDAPLVVTVTGSKHLVATYASGRLPNELPETDRQLVRIVALRGLVSVLNRAFAEDVRSQYGSVDALIETLVLKKGAKVDVTEKGVGVGLREADCHIIPCDPKECKVQSCATDAFSRFRKK